MNSTNATMRQPYKYLGKSYWDSEKISLFGTMSDEAFAKRLGIKRTQVFTKRNSLGIAAFREVGPKEWNQKSIRLLGRKSDQEVAEMLGLAKTTVANKRRSLGIASFARKTKLWRIWSPEELALLGKHTDKEIARRLKMREANVTSKRHHLGIAPFRPRKENTRPRPNAVKWTGQNLALLGKLPDEQVCDLMGVSRKSVMRKRKELGIESYAVGTQFWHQWTEEEIARLGTITDRELAEQLGVQIMCVIMKRNQMGIQSFSKSFGIRKSHTWTKRQIALLGKKTDSVLAHELGLGIGVLRKKRIELGITPKFGEKTSPGKWTPEILARLGKEPLQAIASEIGVSREAVRQKCVKLGIPPRRSQKPGVLGF